MDEGLSNFKALRAKFQEEALLAQSKTSRPAVAEKPKHLPPPGVHCSSMVSSINIAVENKTPVVPRVIFRDGLRGSGGKRPISFPPQPPQTSPSSHLANGDNTTRQSLKDRHMPLVLPVLPVKEPKTETPARKEQKLEPSSGKDVLPQTKIKKKGLLLPFKSARASKVSAENGEEPAYDDWTTRPSSAPAELPSVEKQTTDDGVSLQSDQSTAEFPLSSPDIPITPPPPETASDFESKIISTLEKAKKKFSRKQMFISVKPKSTCCPDYTSRDQAFPSPPKSPVEPELPVPPPVCLPHMACLSARPFFKANHSARKPALDKHFGRDKALTSVKTGEPRSSSAPQKKPLPDLRTLGAASPKPPRPPLVDLSCYQGPTVNEVSPGISQALSQEPETEHPSRSILDAPEFPEFESSEMETEEGEAVDIGALELEALDLVGADLSVPDDFGVTDFEDPQPDLSVCDPEEPLMNTGIQDLNLGNQNIIPLDPASFPQPINFSVFQELSEQWSESKELITDQLSSTQTDGTDLGDHLATQDMDNATLNDRIQLQPSVFQQDGFYETSDNVYEDVENINKLLLGQNWRKLKSGPKNPYSDNLPMKEEASLNIWPRNPWGIVPAEHAQPVHNHIHSKERQSPNNADHKEQKKKEKHRLEKEKKEQKEREKKENEMKKKFKVTGEEEPMYHAKVLVASKVRKNDLPVKSGDTVSIIRTTNCPKGKWLARDVNRKYGYISVMNVELNIKEMLELGKKAQAAGRGSNLEGDTISIGSRSSSHVVQSSFTDDSEEWACEDETLSPSNESHSCAYRTASLPEMPCANVGAPHSLSDANLEDLQTQTRHEALQKLAIFFQHGNNEFGNISDGGGATPTNAEPSNFLCAVEEPPYPEQEVEFAELELLPPPPLYADTF